MPALTLNCRVFARSVLQLALVCLAFLVFAGETAQAEASDAPRRVMAPLPPPRPFDLLSPGPNRALGLRTPANTAADTPPGQPAGGATAVDPAPRAVAGAPMPPRRPEIAPLSNPKDEEEEPAWPRRTPQQRNLDFEPRVPPADIVQADGITTDPGTSTRCLPAQLQKVLAAVVQRYGSVRVTSTYRPAWRARRNSYHRRCQAMDMRVPGQSPRAVLQFVKTLPETGGHKVYWSGLVHVDTGPWRSW